MSEPIPEWLSLEVSVFRRPTEAARRDTLHAHGIELACLDARSLTRDNLFPVLLDEVLVRLAALPGVDAEPDGFFVWTGRRDGRTWKLNGHLFELEERLWRMDLHGECPTDALDGLLGTVGWPATGILFQLVRLGVTVDENDGRRWAALEWRNAVQHVSP